MSQADQKLAQLKARLGSLDDSALDRLRQQLMSEAVMSDDDEPDAAVSDALEMIDDELDRRAQG